MGIFRSTVHSEISDTSQPEDDLILDDDETQNYSTDPSMMNFYKYLTHVSVFPSTFGETDDDRNTLESNDDDDYDTELIPWAHDQYGLRPHLKTNYSFMSKTDIISDADESKFSTALRLAEQDLWLSVIK